MTGMSKVIMERTKAQTPGLPAILVERHVQVEPSRKQELHQVTEEQRIQALIKQDDIPRINRPGTSMGNLRDPWWEIKADYQSKFLAA